jgi:hypothetical protein
LLSQGNDDILIIMNYEKFEYLRSLTIPDVYAEENTDNPYAMTFIVDDRKDVQHTGNGVVRSVITAMLFILSDPNPEVRVRIESWLQGRIRKIVKRGRGKAYADAIATGLNADVITPFEHVAVFAPERLSDITPAIRKLQLTGLNTTSIENETVVPNSLKVSINFDVEMTVAKAAVQAAHAVQLFIMRGNEKDIKTWFDNDCEISIAWESFLEDDSDAIYVHDAGYTEVPVGALTAKAVFVS